jgi:hypothetical protein
MAYAAALVGVSVFVVKPMLDRRGAERTGESGSSQDISTLIDAVEKNIQVVTTNAEATRKQEVQQKKSLWTANSIAAMRQARARIEANRRLLGDGYAEVWFGGDRAAGAAMVEVELAAWQREIDAHADSVEGNEWMYQPGMAKEDTHTYL